MLYLNIKKNSSKKMKLGVLIPARYNSTRIPNKPLIKINNQSMVCRTVEKISKVIDKKNIFVISDNQKVLDEFNNSKINTILSKKKTLNGTERCSNALLKIKKKYDYYLIISCDNPFINQDIIKFIKKKLKKKNKFAVTVHKRIDYKSELTNLGIAKIVIAKNNDVMYLSRNPIPSFIKQKKQKNFSHHGIVALPYFMLLKYKKLKNTYYQLAEDNEWLKLIEHGFVIKSYLYHKINSEINDFKDLEYYIKNEKNY